MTSKTLYYLASPYSHDNKFVQNVRYEMTLYASYILIERGYRLLEPIAQCHQQSLRYDLPGGYDFWQDRDRDFISRCDAVLVLKFPGWAESKGVTDEINYAIELKKPVYYIDVDTIIDKDLWSNICYPEVN